jgi:hypothetical protein
MIDSKILTEQEGIFSAKDEVFNMIYKEWINLMKLSYKRKNEFIWLGKCPS